MSPLLAIALVALAFVAGFAAAIALAFLAIDQLAREDSDDL